MNALIVSALLAGPAIPVSGLPECTPELYHALQIECNRQQITGPDDWTTGIRQPYVTPMSRPTARTAAGDLTKFEFHELMTGIWKYRDDVKDTPLLDDLHRFPDLDTADTCLLFAWHYARNLESQATWDSANRDELVTSARSVRANRVIWELLHDANFEFYSVRKRRLSLRTLREQLGLDNYFHGVMPPHVPWWTFRDVGS